jgi:SAM-dependent methyltransferase
VAASPAEIGYIEAMSRPTVVEAYSTWKAISTAETLCLDFAFEPGTSVLDMGCGAGRFAMHLGDLCGSYLGVDASHEMIDAARKNCPNLTFVLSDIVDFTAEPATYDVVLLMGNVLDFLQPDTRRRRLLALCSLWLRPGGALVGSSHLTKLGERRGYYAEDYHGAEVENFRSSLSEMIDEVESHGFKVDLATRDYRGSVADWSYWVAKLPGSAILT